MKIVFCGGSTGGALMPLFALKKSLEKKTPCDFLLIGSGSSMEKKLAADYGIDQKKIFSGKWRRYFSLWNLVDPWKVLLGICQSYVTLKTYRPDVIVSVGGFVAVPVFIAAQRLKIPCLMHQQDVKVGLANRICSRMATKITVTFEITLQSFQKEKTELTGNLVRPEILSGSKEKAYQSFGLTHDFPVLLITGGGSGALHLNEKITTSLPILLKRFQVIHLLGEKKDVKLPRIAKGRDRYHAMHFATDAMADILSCADIVVSRAGMSTLTELCFLKKVSLLIPLPRSHQEENARYFEEKKAALTYDEASFDPNFFSNMLMELFDNDNKKSSLQNNIGAIMMKGANERISDIIITLAKSKNV